MVEREEALREAILRDRYVSHIFSRAEGRALYLVGGYLRDTLRGIPSKDRDFLATGDIMTFVRSLQVDLGGSIVPFHKKDTLRLVLPDSITCDFTHLTTSLEENLKSRDFTLNALAWSPVRGLVDCVGGTSDIENKVIRAISAENLANDPVRMIRAYRFAAEMDGDVLTETREIIKQLKGLIVSSPPERITLEFFHLLNVRTAATYLKMALDDSLLSVVLYIPVNNLRDDIKALHAFETYIYSDNWKNIQDKLHVTISQNLTYKGLLSLELLLGGRSHMRIPTLSPSRKISDRIRKVSMFIKGATADRKLSREELFEAFVSIGHDETLDVLLVRNEYQLQEDLRELIHTWKRGLADAREIIALSGISKGPVIGELIRAVKRAEYGGEIRSRSELVELIRGMSARANN